MGGQKCEKTKKHICAGLLAHVDAGKTTLSEALLYLSGAIRRQGRVDSGDAFLDHFALERERGITIFSKQASLTWNDMQVTLLDTPGHVDFSAEMERTLQVLDAAVLVISGADGVQGHTRTLWYLLKRYGIPVFLFVNKMDQDGTDREALMSGLKERLDPACVDFSRADFGDWDEAFYEETAVCDEEALEQFLEEGRVAEDKIASLVRERKLFPCFFGSALRLSGVEELLEGLYAYSSPAARRAEFGARVFKIARDGQGNRLTYMKITGGSLKVKSVLCGGGEKEDGEKDGGEKDSGRKQASPSEPGRQNGGGLAWAEKVNQIRIYSGTKYELAEEAEAGSICAVTGLTRTRPGEGLGAEAASEAPLLQPVLSYQIKLPPECQAASFLPKLRQLEEEEPELHIVWNEELQEIHAQVMGEVQTEILKSLILERYGVDVEFGTGNIVYKETIVSAVEGVGHFEPLRHYAEVHLLLEPGEPGSGLRFASCCSRDVLEQNWQRLVLTHLMEKEHRGVLVGAPITDMKITLLCGRAHLKHTEGGDFRQATYRAVRQGLMQADCLLLEPWYEFRLELPEQYVGRAMTDIEKMCGTFQPPETEKGTAVLTGTAPVASMRDYQREVTAYSRGHGRLFCTLKGYEPCHNTAEVMERAGYEPLRDVENTPDSVFCAHGAGFVVPWDRVPEYMHLPALDLAGWKRGRAEGGELPAEDAAPGSRDGRAAEFSVSRREEGHREEAWVGTEEIDEILKRTYHANRKDKDAPGKAGWGRRSAAPSASMPPVSREWKPSAAPKKEKYLLVDGYNIIFAWEDLRDLAQSNVDGARGRLLDVLSNYRGTAGCEIIVVFDAYRVQGHQTEILDYHNIHVVYTREAETADQYIEKFTHENGKKYEITVATSDGLEQIIIRGAGSRLLSARDLLEEVRRSETAVRTDYLENQRQERSFLLDGISEELRAQLERMQEES